MSEEFLLDIIAVLNEQATKKKIKEGLKSMDNSMYVKVISKLSIALSRRQLKKDLKQLNDLYLQVGADLKINSALKKKLQGRIKTLQDSISDLQIGVRAKDSDIARSVTEARNKGQRVASRTSIDFNIEVKKEKAIADLEYMAKKYSKLFSNAFASSKYNNILNAAYEITDAKQLSNVRAQIAAFTSELKANNLASQSLGDKWKRLIDRAKDLFSAASAVTLIFSQVKQAVSSFLQLDTAMTNLYKVQDQITSRDQFSGLLTKWNKLAQNLAVTTNSLISSMEAWSKIGFNLDMSEQLAEITSIFEKTAEISNEKATSTLISAAQAFTEIDDLGVDDYVKRVEAVGNKINAIGNKYAISSEGIADGLQNASAALKVAGNDLNETIALITTTNKIYQNPDEGSNMVKVASMRLRGQVDALKEMGEDAEGVSTDLTKIQQQVYELTGNKVNIFEDEDTMKSTYQMILEIGEVFNSLNDRSQADLLEVMFGKQRASAGASLLLNYEELEKIKNDSMNAANSMAEEYSKYMESAEASLTIFKEKLVETYSTFMSGDMIKYTADMGSGLLDLVNATDLLRHGLVGIVSLNIGKGITSIGASIASTVKQMNTLGNALQQVKNLPVDKVLRKESLQELGEATKNLTEKNLKLLLSQKQLEETDRIIILGAHDLTSEEAKLKLEKMGLLSVTKSQTTANAAEAATTGTLKNAMLSLKTTAKEVGATIKGMFANNPIGMGLMLATTAFSMLSTAVSKHNEKLEETRRANIESATTASENADKLKDLYNEYTRLASIQDRTISEEEAFKTAIENITVALGDKAEILKDLTAGTDEYADALARVTKEELQSQAVTATIGRKASEEEFQGKIWSDWSGSQVTIDSNDKGKALSDEAQKAVDIVSESLKEYETINRTWKNISWDISSDDPTEALEYYNSLVEAREKLVLASENDESLLDTEIYEDLNTAINSMSESLDTYIEKLYEEQKLNYMAQNGIPSVTEEYKAMESALVSAAGSSVDLQNRFKELLTSDFSDLATDIGNVGDVVGDASAQAQSTIPLFNQLASSEEALDTFQSSVKSAADAYSTLMSDNYSPTDMLDSIQAINEAVTEMGGSLNWEYISKQTDSLDLLGGAIEHVTEKYAESVLSGAGIDTESKFGQMLANNIIQAQKSSTQLDILNDHIDSLQSAYSNLTDIVDTYNETGYITFDQLQMLLEMEPQYISCLIDENGQLQLNEAAMNELANKRLDDAEAQAIQQAISELGQIALHDEKQAVQENAEAFTNAVNDLAGYNAELANTIAEATVGAAAIRDLNAAINGAETQGASDEQINTVLDNLNTKLQLIENVRDKVSSGGLGSVVKSGSSKGSASSKDKYKEAYDAELKELEHMHKLGLISDEEYWKARMDLNEKYFGESSGMHEKYLDEYRDNEEDILEGIKNLWKDYYDDRKNDLKDLISYAEKLYDKEIDSLEASIEKLEERRDTEKKYWQSQIDDIDDEIDALEDANNERERAINLQEKQWVLQQAMHQRTMLLYKDGQMVWVNDTKAERDARNDLDSAKHDNKVADLKKQQKDLQKQLDIILETYDLQIEAIEKQIDSLKEVKSAWSEIAENQELKELEERLKSIFGDDVKDKILSGNTDFMNSIVSQYSDTSDMLKTIEDATLADIQNMIAQYGMLPENLMPVTDVINDMADGFSNIAESASNAASAISGSGNVSARSNSQPSKNTSSGSTGGNTSSLKDSIAQASTGSVEEINKISDAFAGENEEGNSVTGAIQKVIDKVGSSDTENNDSDSLMSALSEQTTAALDEENGIPAQKTAWEELNEPLSKAVESVTTLQSTLEDMDGKEFTVILNVVGGGAPNSIVSEFSNGASNSTSHGGGGSSRTEGNAYAEGTTGKYKGLPKAEKNALVSEYGQTEMTVLPNGKTIITDEPTLMDLPKDTVIFNEEQTKKIMDNKMDVSGTAHADGTDDSIWTTLADGTKIRPLQPGDKMYDLQQKFEAYFKSIDGNVEKLVPNSYYEHNRELSKLADQISYANNIVNNKNQPVTVNQNVTLNCPNLTNNSGVEYVQKELGHLSQMALQAPLRDY